MTPRPVLFDLDGTLIDSIELLVGSMHAAFEGRAHRPTDEEWIALIGTPLVAMLHRWVPDPDDAAEALRRYRAFQLANHDRLTQAYPGVLETVRELAQAGHPLGVVTSKTLVLADQSLRYTGLAAFFSVVAGIESTERHKPDPEPVHYALNALGATQPARALFVGDSTHDIFAGNAAGVVSVAAMWGPYSRQQLAEAKPTVWLRNIRDLGAAMAELDARGQGA